jgi:HAD superfamily hydrolase (TIGR01509 family)
MTIQAIFFDLDGVLVNTRQLHYEAFRDALYEVCPTHRLSWETHERELDGLSTKAKLQKLQDKGVLTKQEAETVWLRKQELTNERLPNTVQPNSSLRQILLCLQKQGLRIVCVSNSVRKTVKATLEALGIIDLFEAYFGNDDVKEPKPSPDIYLYAFQKTNLLPKEVLIVEDSPPGRKAAFASGAFVLEVESAEDVSLALLQARLHQISSLRSRIFSETNMLEKA